MWLVGSFIGLFTCVVFDISLWWTLIPLFIGFFIDYHMELYRSEVERWERMSDEDQKQEIRSRKIKELLK